MPTRTKTKVHEFTLILANLEEFTPEVADALYQIFDDGTAGSCNGVVMVDFHREGRSFEQAVQSAIDDVRQAGFQAARVETEETRLVEQINAGLARAG